MYKVKVKVKWSRYRPGVAQRVGRGIALLFHDRGTRRWWVVSGTPRPHFTPGKDPVPIVQEAGWAPGPVWTGGKSRPHRDSIPDRPARSSVVIPTELPGPYFHVDWIIHIKIYNRKWNAKCYLKLSKICDIDTNITIRWISMCSISYLLKWMAFFNSVSIYL